MRPEVQPGFVKRKGLNQKYCSFLHSNCLIQTPEQTDATQVYRRGDLGAEPPAGG